MEYLIKFHNVHQHMLQVEVWLFQKNWEDKDSNSTIYYTCTIGFTDYKTTQNKMNEGNLLKLL